jgi:hypothetical protein
MEAGTMDAGSIAPSSDDAFWISRIFMNASDDGMSAIVIVVKKIAGPFRDRLAGAWAE